MGSEPWAVEVGPPAHDGESRVRRNRSAVSALVTSFDERVRTLADILPYAVAVHGAKPCMGSRELIHIHEEQRIVRRTVGGRETQTPKKWFLYEQGPYLFRTFPEMLAEVRALGSGLRHLGLAAGDCLELYAMTSAAWQLTAHGALSQGIAIVTAYDSLGEQGLTHSLEESGARAIFCDASLLGKLVAPLARATSVSAVVFVGKASEHGTLLKDLKNAHGRLSILTYDELLALGNAHPVEPVAAPKPDDLACIMYTSGSTGPPKGVRLTHCNVLAAIAAVNSAFGKMVSRNDHLLAFLPLAHILEFVFEQCAFVWGTTLGYAHPRTLTDASCRNCKGDIREFRPTIMAAIPAVWETIRKGIIAKVNASNPVLQHAFWGAFRLKSTLAHYHIPGGALLDRVIFRKLKDATGGRLRFCFSGGAPLASETQHFLSTCLCPLIIGYGLTETAAMCCLMSEHCFEFGTVGVPTVCVELKLVDVPDAGYFTNSKPQQGEIWIRGPAVTSGYFNRDTETAKSFTSDGWFMTGDIGEWTPRGSLRIIDRKKNLVKTLNGEYIALEKLESLYRTSRLVGNIMIFADPGRVRPVAVVVPAEAALQELAETVGVHTDADAETDVSELCAEPRVVAAVHEELLATGRRGGLAGIELIDGVALTDDEWTPESGLVTSAMKLNRRVISERYAAAIRAAYGEDK